MTTIETPARRRGLWGRGALATLTAAALVLGAGVGAANAAAGDALVTTTGAPTLTVTPGYSFENGDTITVSGSGYDAATISAATGQVAGLYLSIGSVDTANGWQPSASKPSTSRHAAYTVWVHPGGSGSGEANLSGSTTSDGSFSVTFEVPKLYTKTSADTWAVFTIGSHGVANVRQEQGREIDYTGATTAPPAPGSGSPALQVTNNAGTVSVSGTGYSGASAVGVYVSVGVIRTAGWKPSEGNNSSTRKASDTVWTWSGGPSSQGSGQARLSNGTFTVTLDKGSLPSTPPAGYAYAVYTVGAHGQANSAVEAATFFTP